MAKKFPLEGFRVSVVRAMQDGLKVGAEELLEKMKDNAGLTDHSLDDLEKLGHPYSVRQNQSLHSPDFQVHTQSGRLLNNVKMRQVNQFTIDVGVDDTNVPYLDAVLFGTRYMVARDFVTGSYIEVKDRLSRIFNKAVRKGVNESK